MFKKSIWLFLSVALFFSGLVEARSYRSHLRKATKTNNWYSIDTMSANMVWQATYFSPEFRRAFTKEHAKRKYLNAVEAARFTAEQEQRQTEVTEFFMAVYTKKPYQQFELG